MDQSVAKPLFSEEAIAASRKPLTLKSRVQGIAVAFLMAGAGAAMWVWHQFYVSDLIPMAFGREPRHMFRLKLDFVWCRPTGALLILVAAVVLLGALTKPSPKSKNK
jgi:hypothetical protein